MFLERCVAGLSVTRDVGRVHPRAEPKRSRRSASRHGSAIDSAQPIRCAARFMQSSNSLDVHDRQCRVGALEGVACHAPIGVLSKP